MTGSLQNAATRRSLLAMGVAGGGALGGASLAGAASAAPSGGAEYGDPRQRLRAYMLMRGALDDRLVVGCLTGRYYGVVDNELTPLYGVLGATFSRYRALDDGGYEAASYEIPFFTDLSTGDVIDQFLNPYTGRRVAVVHGGYPASSLRIGSDLQLTLPKPPAGLTMEQRVRSPTVIGEDVWITEETMTALQIPGAAKPVRYSELVSLHAKTTDLADPGAQRVACQTSYSSVVSWRPWLRMGDQPGHLLGYGVGSYGVALDALPPAWTRAVRSRRPDALKDPGAPLAALFG